MLSLESGEDIASYPLQSGISILRCIDNTSNNNTIVGGLDSGDIVYNSFNKDNKFRMKCIKSHDDIVSSICPRYTHPNQFYSCSWDGSIKLWDLTTMKDYTPIHELSHAHAGIVSDICSSNDGHTLYSTGSDGFIRIWDYRTPSTPRGKNAGWYKDECIEIINIYEPGSCILGDVQNDSQLIVGTEYGNIIAYDIRRITDKSQYIWKQRIHQGRVRRLGHFVDRYPSTNHQSSSPSSSGDGSSYSGDTSGGSHILVSGSDDNTVLFTKLIYEEDGYIVRGTPVTRYEFMYVYLYIVYNTV